MKIGVKENEQGFYCGIAISEESEVLDKMIIITSIIPRPSRFEAISDGMKLKRGFESGKYRNEFESSCRIKVINLNGGFN